MSKFSTVIPIETYKLPVVEGMKSDLYSVELNSDKTAIEIIWGNDKLTTPYTFPMDFPLGKLMELAGQYEKPIAVDKKAAKSKK